MHFWTRVVDNKPELRPWGTERPAEHNAGTTSEYYAFLLFPALQKLSMLRQDSASSNNGSRIRKNLNTKRPNNYIWMPGAVSWLPRSLDLTRYDVFLWEDLKIECIFYTHGRHRNVLEGILAEVRDIRKETFRKETLQKIRESTKLRLNFIKEIEEHHTEIFLNQ